MRRGGWILVLVSLLMGACGTVQQAQDGPGRITEEAALNNYCPKAAVLPSGEYGMEWRPCVEGTPVPTPTPYPIGFSIFDMGDTPGGAREEDIERVLAWDGASFRFVNFEGSIPDCEDYQILGFGDSGVLICLDDTAGLTPTPFTAYHQFWAQDIPGSETAAAYGTAYATSTQTVATAFDSEARFTGLTQPASTTVTGCAVGEICAFSVFAIPETEGGPREVVEGSSVTAYTQVSGTVDIGGVTHIVWRRSNVAQVSDPPADAVLRWTR